MSEEATYTIGELAERAGVTPRTIRYYTAEGLLPRPDTRGQYARYRADQLFWLYPDRLEIAMSITNRGAEPMPFALSASTISWP